MKADLQWKHRQHLRTGKGEQKELSTPVGVTKASDQLKRDTVRSNAPNDREATGNLGKDGQGNLLSLSRVIIKRGHLGGYYRLASPAQARIKPHGSEEEQIDLNVPKVALLFLRLTLVAAGS